RADRDLTRGVEGERAVLEIDEQPVEARGLHRLGDLDGAGELDADAERQFSALEPLARGIANRLHGCPLSSVIARSRAAATKQSRAAAPRPGLLRRFAPRNDDSIRQREGGVSSPGPSARCISTMSIQRPNLKPAERKVPTMRKPSARCSPIEASWPLSPITA